MRLSKSDFFIIILGLSLIAGLGYLLYADITAASGPGNTKKIGKITAARNTTERKYSSRVVWGEVYKDSVLYNYDTVRTADQSETTIRLDDGTEITLNENSMILLALTEDEVDIKFIQGTMNAKQSTSVSDTARKVIIESGDSSVSLKNGDVSISQDWGDRLQMTVNRGTAVLNTGKEEKLINENQNIIAEKESVRLFDLTIRLISPESDAYVDSGGRQTAVDFSWEPLDGKYDTSLEIANNPAVTEPIIADKVRGSKKRIPLADGVYFWRVNAVNKDTGKIESSEIRRVTIFNNRPVVLISPANKDEIRFRDENPMIDFLWSKNESISRYKLLVSASADMSAPLVNTVVEGNRIALNNLGQGKYFWKVANMNDAERITGTAESSVFSFIVTRTEKIEPPVPVYPPESKTVHPMIIVQKGLTFNWINAPLVKETEIFLAKDSDLKNIIFTNKVGMNNVTYNGRLAEGDYYWGLRGVMKDGSMTDYSSIRRFKVVRTGTISLIEPQDREVIINKNVERLSRVDFSWSKTELEGTYRLQLSTEKSFGKILKETSVPDLSAEIPDIREGRYFWRVALLDDRKEVLVSSPTHSFEIMNVLEKPVPISPLAGSSVEMLKKETLNFYWKPVKGAKYYRIGIYQVKGLMQYSIANLETRNNYYVFSDLSKLDVGKFLWTLQAVDIDPATNRVRRSSEEIKMGFNINLDIKGDINLNTPNIMHTE
ncbi:MAG: FecR domain-containing protein [Spirochaetes bacterium]|nr:FecR domain-containing protein [Spirochaetota bacterium]